MKIIHIFYISITHFHQCWKELYYLLKGHFNISRIILGLKFDINKGLEDATLNLNEKIY